MNKNWNPFLNLVIELKKEYFDISRERIEKAFHDNNVV